MKRKDKHVFLMLNSFSIGNDLINSMIDIFHS